MLSRRSTEERSRTGSMVSARRIPPRDGCQNWRTCSVHLAKRIFCAAMASVAFKPGLALATSGSSTGSGECFVLQVLDYATTKVRHYGSAYRLDEHHSKEASEPDWELERLVPNRVRSL